MRDAKQNQGFNKVLNQYRFKRIKKYVRGETCLEVGCGEGQMTEQLSKLFKTVTVIDSDKQALKSVKPKKNVTVLCSTIEEAKLEMFDTIICTNFMEHVSDPAQVLEILRKYGHNKTVYIFTTPNAYSYNRTIGVELGMLANPTDLHEGDITAGHQRVYTPIQFSEELEKANFYKLLYKPIFYKPLANTDMIKLPNNLVDKMLNQDPIHSGAELFAVCIKELKI